MSGTRAGGSVGCAVGCVVGVGVLAAGETTREATFVTPARGVEAPL